MSQQEMDFGIIFLAGSIIGGFCVVLIPKHAEKWKVNIWIAAMAALFEIPIMLGGLSDPYVLLGFAIMPLSFGWRLLRGRETYVGVTLLSLGIAILAWGATALGRTVSKEYHPWQPNEQPAVIAALTTFVFVMLFLFLVQRLTRDRSPSP